MPLAATGGRTVSHVSIRTRSHSLQFILLELRDPAIEPIIGNDDLRFEIAPLSEAGAELVRRSEIAANPNSAKLSMTPSDLRAFSETAGPSPVRYDAQLGYAHLSDPNPLPTDVIVFLHPGWVIGVIVPKDKVHLAPKLKEAAVAGLDAFRPHVADCIVNSRPR